jgi:superfamily II DNA or RNA helicase
MLSLNVDDLRTFLGGPAPYRKFLGLLTVKQKLPPSQTKYGFPISIHAYKQDGKCLILPKIKLSVIQKMGLQPTITEPCDQDPIDVDLEGVSFYDYQSAAIDACMDRLEDAKCCYLQMDTGMGKTRTAIGIIAGMSVKTLVIVPAKSLQSQWAQEFAKLSPNANVVSYANAKGPIVDCDVAICVINTFREKTADFIRDNNFGLVIFDEAHEYYTSKNSNGLWIAQHAQFVLGLSATPLERPDGLDTFICHFIGKPLICGDLPGLDIQKEKFNGKVTRIRYCCDVKYADIEVTSKGTPCNASTLTKVLSDPERQELVVHSIMELFNEGHGIFVFAEHREYLIQLQELLLKFYDKDDIILEDEPIEVAVLRGGTKQDLLNAVRKKGARIVLTTYGYSRRGVSLPRMTGMVLASPRRNGLMQILGRITRKGDDPDVIRHVIDIVDDNTMYRGQFYTRSKVYKVKDWSVDTRMLGPGQ